MLNMVKKNKPGSVDERNKDKKVHDNIGKIEWLDRASQNTTNTIGTH
jgi:hypothetical protein